MAAFASTLVAAACLWRVVNLETKCNEQEVGIVQTLETTWTSGGQSHKVSTQRIGGEDAAVWVARHQAAVAAAQEALPPDEGK